MNQFPMDLFHTYFFKKNSHTNPFEAWLCTRSVNKKYNNYIFVKKKYCMPFRTGIYSTYVNKV